MAKNTVITTVQKFVLFLGLTTQGSFHDYALLKEEFPPELNWFELLKIWVDLGYVGIQKDYQGEVEIPHKKPRKSKKNPDPILTPKQKEENTEKSRLRIFVENAIAGIKRYNILVYKFRNKKLNFDDDVMAIAAGLWNFRIT
ncbi:MAG: transposase family protein [Saprospiraceae bacterium]